MVSFKLISSTTIKQNTLRSPRTNPVGIYIYTVKLGYIKLGFYEYMVYIEVLSRPERNPIDFHVK